ncbi:nitrilase-related carbon-nitrogen hydrolase [Corynebacterium crudilactis]|uniref:CN hydrolase domain-containing protein n=1 Tax=Corynebacterium crudilactis TaxID=1652495 RepID=A0A172QVB1_9CORY|nr:nitrilase-related carbon-nitrogen hydrolase [Corynebacterium crudilactis]ANE04653.1 hypothetical protein ccrud_10845 [Corynebacterium crudilactis]
MNTIRVASCQIDIDIDNPESIRASMISSVKAAADAGASLIVLPELATSGYCFADQAEATRRSEVIPGKWTTFLQEMSREFQIVLVSGISEISEEGVLFSSAIILDNGHLLGTYRKTHLWNTEKQFFEQGNHLPTIFTTSVGKISVAICYDIEFPEVVRIAAEMGAEVLTAPVNWPKNPRPSDSWPIEIFKAMAHAAEYRLPIVIADRCGEERGTDWIGGSIIIGKDGYPLSGPHIKTPSVPEIWVADVEVNSNSRISPDNDAFLDRRVDLYFEK